MVQYEAENPIIFFILHQPSSPSSVRQIRHSVLQENLENSRILNYRKAPVKKKV